MFKHKYVYIYYIYYIYVYKYVNICLYAFLYEKFFIEYVYSTHM